MAWTTVGYMPARKTGEYVLNIVPSFGAITNRHNETTERQTTQPSLDRILTLLPVFTYCYEHPSVSSLNWRSSSHTAKYIVAKRLSGPRCRLG